MGGLEAQSDTKPEKNAIWTGVEVILVLVILCMLVSIAGVLFLRPVVQAEIEKTQALNLILAAPVPAAAEETCGYIVNQASQANGATSHWQVDPLNAPGTYRITVSIQRGADSAVFHWNVDTQAGTITSQESRSICQLP